MNPEDRLRQMLGKARGDEGVTNSKWDDFATSARRSLRVQRFATAGVTVLLLIAIVVGVTTSVGGEDPPPDLELVGSPSPPPENSSDLEPIETWLVAKDGKTLSQNWVLQSVSGPIGSSDPIERELEFLLYGSPPTVEPGGPAAGTAISEGTMLLEAKELEGAAQVNLSQEFLDADSELTMRLRLAQIVFTATQVEGIDKVKVMVEGELFHDEFLTRKDFDDVAPPIVVESPKIGSEHSSPLVVSGSANVFEANVSIELTWENNANAGEAIGTFATATCGSGCRGDFSTELQFNVDKPTDALLNVYEESAEDGSRLHQISIPIRLLPSN